MSLRTAGRGAFVFIFVAVLVDSIGFGIILPVLPRLIMQLTGVSVDRAAVYGGPLSFADAVPQFLCSPVVCSPNARLGSAPGLPLAPPALGSASPVRGFGPAIPRLL